MSRDTSISAQRTSSAPDKHSGIRLHLRRLRSIVFGQMRLSRVDGQIKFDFGAERAQAARPLRATNAEPVSASVAPQKPAPRDRGFALMVGELSISLSAHPRNRTNLRYLAKLEALLLKIGVDAFEAIALIRCRKARKQLDILMAVAPSPGLRALAERLDVAILVRSLDVRNGPDAGPTDFGTYAGPHSAGGPLSDFHVGGVAL